MKRESIVVIREIGRGGNGIVEEVWPGAQASEPAAMKRLMDEDRQHSELVGRFKREAKILRSLNHPNIIRILDADLESDNPWFLMPLASSNLGEEISQGPLSEGRLRSVFLIVLDTLQYAHECGVVHRDLKPENILIMTDGGLAISDFGLGLRINSETLKLTRTGTGRGTEGYAAPEQWKDFARVDHRADIYALGALLYEMSTGQSPLEGDPRSAPVKYQRMIQRCRAHDPERRYQDIAALLEDFRTLFSEDEDITPVAERALRLLETAPEKAADRYAVIELYRRHPNDPDLYSKTLTLWTKELVEAQIMDGLDDIPMIINNLCDQLPGRFDFSYLDQVSSFLSHFYQATEDTEVRELVLTKLLQIGASCNRWNMGRTFAQLAAQAESRHEAMLVRDVLRANPHDALWAATYIRDQVINPLILRTLDEIETDENLRSAMSEGQKWL